MKGIYKLIFLPTSYFYIGWSNNIQRRYNEHTSKLRNNKASEKIQQKYNELGIMPELEILELTEDFSREWYYIKNELDNLFLLNTAGSYDIYSKNKQFIQVKYTREQIIDVLYYLVYSPELTTLELQDLTQVNVSMIKEIKSCRVHKWLKEEFPEQYSLLELNYSRTKDSVSGLSLEEENRVRSLLEVAYNNLSIPIATIAEKNNISYTVLYNLVKGKSYQWLELTDKEKYLAVINNTLKSKSKYSLEEIEVVVDLLLEVPKKTYIQIQEITGMNNKVIGKLKRGEMYRDLLEKNIPEKYLKLKERK